MVEILYVERPSLALIVWFLLAAIHSNCLGFCLNIGRVVAHPRAGTIKYVLFEDSNHSWRVAAVPDSPTSFKSRLALPEPWRGVRDDQLSAQLGLPGCVFVHASGFIGGHASKDGALAMARMALAYYAAEAAAAATKGKEETKGDSNSNEDMASCASNEFCSKKCVPCRGGVPALQGQAVQDFLQKLNAGRHICFALFALRCEEIHTRLVESC